MSERDEGVVRMDAGMWALVAELEALKAERAGMEALNQDNGGLGYDEHAFYDVAKRMEALANRLRTEV